VSIRRKCACFWNSETGYFEPCCEAHEQEYVAHLESKAGGLTYGPPAHQTGPCMLHGRMNCTDCTEDLA